MAKLLLLAVAVWLLYSILKRYARNMDSPPAEPTHDEQMVQCAHCGVHLPQSESVSVASLHFCSEAHASLHNSDQPHDRAQ